MKNPAPGRASLPTDGRASPHGLLPLLRREERVTLALRQLYEAHGYRKFRMNRFEPYDFYARYRDFLADGQIISFTDLDGKLMALRPDVTLSIVRRAAERAAGSERLYYTEPVYRPARGAAGYRESNQVGIESIGQLTPYAMVEVISLAADSLLLISDAAVLDLSHTGFLEGLLEALPLDGEAQGGVRRCLEQKSVHGITALAAGRLSDEDLARLQAACQLSGPIAEALPTVERLASGAKMMGAAAALRSLYEALGCPGGQSPYRLDLSITSDAKYYSGLVMRGYIGGVPTAVLSGGRYDPLLARMGKPQLSAMGFALYFDELARYLSEAEDAHVDTVLLYAPDADPMAVAGAVKRHVARGERVYAATAPPKDIRYDRAVEVTEDA